MAAMRRPCYNIFMQWHRIFLCAVLVWLLPHVSSATMSIPLTLEQMTAHATVIFIGTCEQATTARKPWIGKTTTAMTTYTFTVEEVLKGSLDPKQAFVFEEVGVGSYQPGTSYLAFLKQGKTRWATLGQVMGQGSFKITTAADGSKTVSNGNGNQFVLPPPTPESTKGSTKGAKSRAPRARGGISLEKIRTQIKDIQR